VRCLWLMGSLNGGDGDDGDAAVVAAVLFGSCSSAQLQGAHHG